MHYTTGRATRCLITAIVLLCSGAAWAEDLKGWYVEGQYGLSAPRESDAFSENTDSFGNKVREDFKVDYERGGASGLAIGYGFERIRLELQALSTANDIERQSADRLLTDDYETLGALLNFWAVFRPGKSLRPWAGVGAGRTRVSIDGADKDTAMAQIGAGVDFQITKRLALTASARFVDVGEITYSATGPGAFEGGGDGGQLDPLTDPLAPATDPVMSQGGDDFGAASGRYGLNMDGYVLLAGLRFALSGPPDRDGDGVPDAQDACPDSPRGVQVDESGCERDADGDGVPDSRDKCPNTERGRVVDADGCAHDEDGDGVEDGRDRCPGTPPDTTVDSDGCAKDTDGDGVGDIDDECPHTPRGTEVMSNGCGASQSVVLKGVNFEHDRAVLLPQAREILDQVVQILADAPGFDIEVQGHTDSVGSDAYNLNLSRARAVAVRNYLVDHGIDAGRLHAKGYGESEPIASNDTAEGRARNRRVELKILESN